LLPLPLLLSPPSLFPYTTLFRSAQGAAPRVRQRPGLPPPLRVRGGDRAAPRSPDGHQGAPPAREEPPLPGHGVRRRRVAARAAARRGPPTDRDRDRARDQDRRRAGLPPRPGRR